MTYGVSAGFSSWLTTDDGGRELDPLAEAPMMAAASRGSVPVSVLLAPRRGGILGGRNTDPVGQAVH